MFVVNDDGAWMLRRPQDHPRDQVGVLVDLARTGRFVDLYERMRDCTYVYARYGRFPAATGPFYNLVAFQAHHLDPDFYARFYRPDVLGSAHSTHDRFWH